jgi:Tol biopolymer transport system component
VFFSPLFYALNHQFCTIMMRLFPFYVMCLLLTISSHAQIRSAGEPVLVFDQAGLQLQNPIPSPDGRYILLSGPRYNGLWVMETESGMVRQISDSQGTGFGAIWAYDATQIIARSTRTIERRRQFALVEIDIYEAQTTYLTDYQARMTTTPVLHAGSPSVLIATSSGIQTHAMAAHKTAAPYEIRRPSAHANGNKLFLTLPTSVDIMEFQPFDADQWYLNAAASPDGKKIAFEVYGGNVHILQVSTGELTDLGPGYQPSWSPDSRYISFTRNQDDGYRHTYGEIVVAAADGSESLVLYASDLNIPANPHWHPSTNRIYFDYMHSGTIMAVDVVIEQ